MDGESEKYFGERSKVSETKQNFFSFSNSEKEKRSNNIFFISNEKVKTNEKLNEKHDEADFINEIIEAVRQSLKLFRNYDAIPFAVLFLNREISEEQLRTEIKKWMEKGIIKNYSVDSMKQALSRVKKSPYVLSRTDELGITYYQMTDEAKTKIKNKLIVLTEEKEIEDSSRKAEEADKETLITLFVDFFKSYMDSNSKKVYIEKLKNLLTVRSSKSLVIDWSHLSAWNPNLAARLINEPEMVINAAEIAITIVFKEELFSDEQPKTFVRFVNLPKTILIKNISNEHINKLIQIEAVVTRVGELKPFAYKSVFVCKDCGHEHKRIQQPFAPEIKVKRCENCGSKNVALDVTKSTFIPLQSIRFQELPNNMKPGEPPRILDSIVSHDLVNVLIPGMRVRIVGILRVLPDSSKIATFKKMLEVNSIIVLDQGLEDIEINDEDIMKIKQLVSEPNLEELAVQSFAPAIFGYDDVKLGLILSLFSAPNVELPDGMRLRGEIHSLLIGDPSTAKSTLVRWTVNIAPRAVYTSGRGATVAGITAAAVWDEISRSWMLEGGVLVLADQGVAIIDELDKLSEEAKKSLHEALEHGTVSVSKAGINANLNARATLIAAANPKYGRWNRYKSVVEQINIDPALLSRFDLIFVFIDEPEEEFDSQVAHHILSVRNKKKEAISTPIPLDLFKKWIAYAKLNINPVIPESLWKDLEQYYVELRSSIKKYAEKHGIVPIPITVRQLEAMIRLAQARARMFLREKVTAEDIMKAKEIIEYMLKHIAMDSSGIIDVSILEVGKSAREIEKMDIVVDSIKFWQDKFDFGAPLDEIVKECEKKKINSTEVKKILDKLMEEGKVYSPRDRYYRLAM